MSMSTQATEQAGHATTFGSVGGVENQREQSNSTLS
jgi:hypothetical protein